MSGPAVDDAVQPAAPHRNRLRIVAFVTVGAVCFAVSVLGVPLRHPVEMVVALVLFVALTAAALLVRWRSVPRWLWPIAPIGYVAVIGLMRDAQGHLTSSLVFLYLLPVVWLALNGRRIHVVAGLVAVTTAMAVPIVLVGGPVYPPDRWRNVTVDVVVSSLVALTVMAMVARDRAHAARLAQRSAAARDSEARAVEARAQLEAMLAAATSTAVIGADRSGTVMFFSGGAEHALGYRADEVVGRRSIFDLADPEELRVRADEVRAVVDTAAGRVPTGESGPGSVWTYVRKDGTRRRAELLLSSRYQDDELIGWVLVANDVTEREQLAAGRARLAAADAEVAEVLAAQNQRLRELTRMKDDVAATVSHELRTPLTSIRGFVELLLHDGEDRFDAETLWMLRTIDRNSRQLLRVAEDLAVDPSGRGVRIDFTDVDLSALAAEAVESEIAEAVRRRIRLSCVAGPPVPVRGDPARLHQMLGNLLTNALKFSPPGGNVEVRVYATEQLAHLDVLDDGPGISQADRSHLFERFYRLDHPAIRGVPGTGLGLSIVKSVVDAHEGVVEIVDAPGWSTTFRVLLPLAPHERMVPTPPAPPVPEVEHSSA